MRAWSPGLDLDCLVQNDRRCVPRGDLRRLLAVSATRRTAAVMHFRRRAERPAVRLPAAAGAAALAARSVQGSAWRLRGGSPAANGAPEPFGESGRACPCGVAPPRKPGRQKACVRRVFFGPVPDGRMPQEKRPADACRQNSVALKSVAEKTGANGLLLICVSTAALAGKRAAPLTDMPHRQDQEAHGDIIDGGHVQVKIMVQSQKVGAFAVRYHGNERCQRGGCAHIQLVRMIA